MLADPSAERRIGCGEECNSTRVLAYALTQKTWAFINIGRSAEGLACVERVLSLVDQLSDERDCRYIRLKALCGASLLHVMLADLIKSRARAKELLDFAIMSSSRRALAFGHWCMGSIHTVSGDRDRAGNEFALACDAAPDPFYKAIVETNRGGYLANTGKYAAARDVIDPALRFAEANGLTTFVLVQRANQAIVILGEGQLTKGMDQLEAVTNEAAGLGSRFIEVQLRAGIATIYARIATGEQLS